MIILVLYKEFFKQMTLSSFDEHLYDTRTDIWGWKPAEVLWLTFADGCVLSRLEEIIVSILRTCRSKFCVGFYRMLFVLLKINL